MVMGSLGGLDLQQLVVDVMQPTLRKTPFSGDGWLFEPKVGWISRDMLCAGREGSISSRNKRSLTENVRSFNRSRARFAPLAPF